MVTCPQESTSGHRPGVGFTLLVLLLATSLAAAGTEARNVRFRQLSVEDGLPQAAVNAIVQDSDGLMWFATQEGVARYDGYELSVFKNEPEDARSLPHNWVWTLLLDRNGVLWAGTDGGGLARFDAADDGFTSYPDVPGGVGKAPENRVRVIAEDRSGLLWIGTDGGLRRFDPQTGEFILHLTAGPQGLGDDRVRAILEDVDGSIWIGTDGGGLDRLEPGSGEITSYRHDSERPDSIGDDRVRSLRRDGEGGLWVGTYENGLDRFDRSTGRFRHFRHDPAAPASLAHNRVRAIHEDSLGKLWIGTDDGLSRYNQDDGVFSSHRSNASDPASLLDSRVLSIFEDRGGVLWVGTYSGVSRWNLGTGAFAHYHHDPLEPGSLSGNAINAFAETPDGSLWVASYGSGLDRLDGESGRFEHFAHAPDDPASLADNRVMSLRADRNGALWVGMIGHGLDRFDPLSGRFEHFRHDPDDPESLSANGVTSIFEDRSGVLWIGTYRGGLNRLDAESGRFVRFQKDPRDARSLSDDRVLTIYEDRERILWIGTEAGGLNRFDPRTEEFSTFRHDPANPRSLSSDTAWAIFEDSQRALWVATQGGGLNRWAPADRDAGRGVFRRFTERDGLPSATIYGILEDESGNLWLSSNRGIAKFDPSTETFRRYDTSHGLQGHEFNFGASLRRTSGELVFGGTNGFNSFLPDSVRDNPHLPDVVLTAVYKSNRLVSFETPLTKLDEIVLTHRDHVVSFEFAALDFTAPQNNRYMYRLDGFDEDWMDIGTARRASYTNLPPGDFTFQVKASNNDGLWNEAGIALQIQVLPPPWKTWWAYGLYVLAGLTIVLSYMRSQRRRLQEAAASREVAQAANRAKSEFLATVSHELRTPMNGVMGMTELLLDTTLDDRQQHLAQSVQGSAQNLLGIINDILDFSKIDTDRLQIEETEFNPRDVLEALHEQFAGPAGERNNRLSLQLPDSMPLLVRGDAGRVRQVLGNLLSNAVKFTEEGEIALRVDCPPERDGKTALRFEIRDTGVGIPPEQRERIFEAFSQADSSNTRQFGGTGLGLAISKRIVELMGGTLGVESEPGSGSTFWFECPLRIVEAAPEREPLPEDDLGGLRVLIAAKDETERDLLHLEAKHLGATDTVTADLEGAWAAMRQAADQGQPIDIVIIDSEIPGGGGIELVRRLKAEPQFSGLECLLLVPVGTGFDPEHVSAAGIRRCLVKPIRLAQLRECLVEAAGLVPRPQEGPPRAGPAERQLLLVEDSVMNREICVSMLEAAGYDVDVAENGEEGLHLATTRSYRAILMDLQMPVMDGFEATRRIREEECANRPGTGPRRVPIIAVTANTTEQDREKSAAVEMDDFLAKPFSKEQLLEKLDRWLSPTAH